MNYSSSRHRNADRYLPAQIAKVAEFTRISPHHIQIASRVDDIEHATDLILPNARVSLRVRHFTPAEQAKYRGQFTIRSSVDRSGKSEWDKIVAGEVGYLLYSFAGDDDSLAASWFIDLKVLVEYARRGWAFASAPDEINVGDANFYVFDLNRFPCWPFLCDATDQPETPCNDRIFDTLLGGKII